MIMTMGEAMTAHSVRREVVTRERLMSGRHCRCARLMNFLDAWCGRWPARSIRSSTVEVGTGRSSKGNQATRQPPALMCQADSSQMVRRRGGRLNEGGRGWTADRGSLPPVSVPSSVPAAGARKAEGQAGPGTGQARTRTTDQRSAISDQRSARVTRSHLPPCCIQQ
jgi:hypothetical protein